MIYIVSLNKFKLMKCPLTICKPTDIINRAFHLTNKKQININR
tara:strand:+ start:13935 stop:14063 length:129 start_codon:yes stop_codon:yes gene_type:complete